jgi:hypothetical protein
MNAKETLFEVTKEPLAGCNLTNFLRLLAHNRFRIDLPYIPRFLYTLLLCGVMSPFRFVETAKYSRAVRNVELCHNPLFILGHWRSGTTFLHNVLSCDPHFGYFTTFQAYIPGVFLSAERIFKPVVSTSIPKKRPMDGVDMGVDLPQEDQYALGAYSPFSYYHGWCFPRTMARYNRLALLQDVPESAVAEWKKTYVFLLKKIAPCTGNRRLLLKNQDNTARVRLLLDLFPDAKFIHIHRNPYHVFFSMMRFMTMVIPLYCLQTPPSRTVLEDVMLDFYAGMYKKYLAERPRIPRKNLVEMPYEAFVDRPLAHLRDIYGALSLEGFDAAEPAFKRYLSSQKSFRPARYAVTDEVRDKVSGSLGFLFDAFGYEK